jgi:alpha-glucosidase
MKTVFACLCLLIMTPAYAQKTIRLTSPGGKIVFSSSRLSKGLSYKISYKGIPVIAEGTLGLDFSGTDAFGKSVKAGKPQYRSGTETYELLTGKTKNISDRYNEVVVPLVEQVFPFRSIDIQVRIFDEGLAFRYLLKSSREGTSFMLEEEATTFRFPGDPATLALFLPGFTSSHEGEYMDMPLSKVPEDTLIDMPALFRFPGDLYVAITEAALLDYAGMYLKKKGDVLTSELSPLPDRPEIKVKGNFPHQSPWRVLMISDRIGELLESTIITSLNEPCRIKDISWLRPGKTTFPWWNGNIVPDTSFAPGNNFETNKYYIDFCARNGIEYHSVVEYGLHQWYHDDGVNFQPGPNADVTRPVPGLDMQAICDYAGGKGVGIRLWVHWAALYPKLDTAFSLFEKWGIKGLMIDFMDRDDQEMVNIQTEMLEKAARHKLHVQFHGAYKPTGLSRTYPNEFTREGTLNYEVNKWDKRVTPEHDLNIAFTRLLAGSTDYHLGGFRAVPESSFKVQHTRPLMMGTRCHMLAMYIILENPLGMVCDYPAAYEGQPGFDFVRKVPTAWDEIIVPDARIHQYLVMIKRKGRDWFAAAINNNEERAIILSLEFLPAGLYKAMIYADADDAHLHPNHLRQETRLVTKKDSITLPVKRGGGMAVHFLPEN